jgi:hypothetical protein
MSTIFEFVKEARDSYRTETVEVAEGYDFSQSKTLPTIELYHNSKFTSGQTEAGREKPFYNICKFRVNVATRATDLDTTGDRHCGNYLLSAASASASFARQSRRWSRNDITDISSKPRLTASSTSAIGRCRKMK